MEKYWYHIDVIGEGLGATKDYKERSRTNWIIKLESLLEELIYFIYAQTEGNITPNFPYSPDYLQLIQKGLFWLVQHNQLLVLSAQCQSKRPLF